MPRQTENKIVLVTRQTRLAELVTRFNTVQQAKFYVEHLGADFSDYLQEDDQYHNSTVAAQAALENCGRLQIVDRRFLPNFVFGPQDTVVVLGQDGLVANTVKYLAGQPVIGVNPDPKRWDGQLLPFVVPDLAAVVPEVFAQRRPTKPVTMAKAQLNNGQVIYAVNDLFIGPKSHTSIRYAIRYGQREERQSSSGIVVSTGVGSTGWFKSLLAGATGLAQQYPTGPQATGKPVSAPPVMRQDSRFPWDADYLCFTIREPFPSRTTGVSIVFGRVTEQQPLQLTSFMPENGVIFSDGIERDFLDFNSGLTATIGVAEKKGCLVV